MFPLCFSCCFALAADSVTPPIVVESVLVTVARQAEVPARESAILVTLLVREGQRVAGGELLGRLDDAEAKLAVQRAEFDLQRAKRLANNDVKIRLAKKDLDLANLDLSRASHANQKLDGSVSAADLDRLRQAVERAALEVEQAEFDSQTAKHAVAVVESDLTLAQEKLRRRQIISPLAGMVVAVPKRQGEWVEPGQSVLRIMSTDKYRVEGFLPASQTARDLTGKRVRLSIPVVGEAPTEFAGELVFVSLEVDPQNNQVRFWAEVANRDGLLRPGLSGSLTIDQ